MRLSVPISRNTIVTEIYMHYLHVHLWIYTKWPRPIHQSSMSNITGRFVVEVQTVCGLVLYERRPAAKLGNPIRRATHSACV